MNFLMGKKTYVFAALFALATFAKAVGWIDGTTFDLLAGLLGAGGLASLRAGVAKNGN